MSIYTIDKDDIVMGIEREKGRGREREREIPPSGQDYSYSEASDGTTSIETTFTLTSSVH